MDLISDTAGVEAACASLATEAFLTIDTEFLRDSTYWPRLCLIQMAAPDKTLYLIDPLAKNIELGAFWALMANENVLKVFHAARQDIEIIHHMAEVIPAPILDTQVAAAVCGFGESISYDQLVRRTSSHEIDKSHRFTDWSRRPLTTKQLHYAAADVTHLVDVYGALADQLEENGRAGWMDSEMAVLTDPQTYEADPANAWKRLKNRVRKPREFERLKRIAAWREDNAQSRDVPRNRILKDDAIYELALQGPQTADAMDRLRAVSRGFGKSKDGKDIMALIAGVDDMDKSDLPKVPKPARHGETPVAIADLLKSLLKHVGEEHGVATRLIANSDDIDAIARGDGTAVPALKGWRYDLFGRDAERLKRGEIALAIEGGGLRIVEVE